MKFTYYLCLSLLGAAGIAQAGPLDKQQIASNAKWLVHVDCDNLRQTQVGDYLLNKVLAPKLTEMTGDLKINASNILQRISSLTAFGAEFKNGPQENGVLLINTDGETQKALEGLLIAQMLANTNGPVQKLDGDEQNVYSFSHEIFISPRQGGPIVISKSQDQIDAMHQLLGGKSPTLAASKTFAGFPMVTGSFFVVGAADAFSKLNMIPAQAKVLQMADGGCVSLGQKEDQLSLDVSLRGRTPEGSRQIQQVIEGMVALVNLGQPDVPDVVDLAKTAKVSTQDRLVTLNIQYPADKAISRFNEIMNPKPRPAKAAKRKAHKEKAKPEAEESSTKPEADAAKPEANADASK